MKNVHRRPTTAPTACSPSTASAGGSPAVGYGQGDSAYLRRRDPTQKKPKWTTLDHNSRHENVLGYSGTNSKYVNITTVDLLQQRRRRRPEHARQRGVRAERRPGTSRTTTIFWNNFNYFLPNSPVHTVSGGLGQIGDLTIQYPTGVGVVLFGGDGWMVRENNIFGNFKWGAAAFSDPFNAGRRRSQQQPVHRTTRWAATAPTRTASTSSTTAPAGATASRATPARRSTRARTRRRRGGSLSGLPGARPLRPAPAPTRATAARSATLAGYVHHRPALQKQQCAGSRTPTRRSRSSSRSSRRPRGRRAHERRATASLVVLAASPRGGRRCPAGGAAPSAKRRPYNVKVRDDYYSPIKVRRSRRATRSSGPGAASTPTPTTSLSRRARRA